MSESTKVKGKRSKKNVVQLVEVQPVLEPIVQPIGQVIVEPIEELVLPKRGKVGAPKKDKKPPKVVAIVTPNGIEGNFAEPRKPLIVHLPFKSNEIKFTDAELRYNPELPQPVPYETDGTQIYFQLESDTPSQQKPTDVSWDLGSIVVETAKKQHVEPEVTPQPTAQVTTQPTTQEIFHRTKILTCYATKPGELLTLPTHTDIQCYWCSNTFENAPCFLPAKEENSIYHVYGNFCTPQCGLAYLLNEHLDSHVRWERMSLLHRMYRPVGATGGRLYPAPPRESLIGFGGIHTYEAFREIIQKSAVRVDIHRPPMISILGTLDTKPIDL
jgi:hypothetical protein